MAIDPEKTAEITLRMIRAEATIERVREVRMRLDLIPHPQEPHVVMDIAEALDLALDGAS